MVIVASCSATVGNSIVAVLAIGAVMFVITALGVSWRRFLQRRLFPGSVDRLTSNPALMGLAAAVFGMILFGTLFVVFGLTEPNSCG